MTLGIETETLEFKKSTGEVCRLLEVKDSRAYKILTEMNQMYIIIIHK